MVMAMLAVRNLFGEAHDLWAVNADDEYHEEVRETPLARDLKNLAATQPRVPTSVVSDKTTGGLL